MTVVVTVVVKMVVVVGMVIIVVMEGAVVLLTVYVRDALRVTAAVVLEDESVICKFYSCDSTRERDDHKFTKVERK